MENKENNFAAHNTSLSYDYSLKIKNNKLTKDYSYEY